MAQTLELKLKGIYSNPNNLGTSVPDGALEQCTNFTIDSDDIAEVRRGFSRLGGPFSAGTDRAQKYFVYQSQLLSSYTGNKMAWYSDNVVTGDITSGNPVVTSVDTTGMANGQYVYGVGIPANTTLTINAVTTRIDLSNNPTITGTTVAITASGWVNYTGSHFPNSSTFKVQSAEANQNFYYTTANGVQKLSAYNDSTSVNSGEPRGLDITGTRSDDANGFLSANSQVGYRAVWGYKDANDNVILGAPSNQTVVAGTTSGGSNSKVTLTVVIPSPNVAITSTDFVQIYRSKGSAGAAISPTEDMQLVYENNPTDAELGAGSMTIEDNRPYALMGAFLYTSPSEEGIRQSNEQPPQSKCIAAFKDSLFYGNTTAKQRLNITMVGVGQETTAVLTNGSNTAVSIAATGVNTAWGSLVQQSNGATNIIAANTTIEATGINATAVDLSSQAVMPVARSFNSSAIIVAEDVINGPGHGYATGQIGQFSTSAADLPDPLAVSTNYAIISINSDYCQVAANATAAAAGIEIVLNDAGTGTHTFTPNLDVSITVSANVTIAGVVYQPRTTETARIDGTNAYYKVYVSGSIGQDIADTAQSLVRVINATNAQTNVVAYYSSSIDELPGQITIEEADLGGSAFTATTPVFGTEWSPVLPSSGTSVSSVSEKRKNGIYFSKLLEPEAVPLFNNFRIGSAASEILNMVSVRDSLFVLKEDGIWRILGQDAGDFRVEVVDLSTVLYGPETAVELNNQIFALTNQGVVMVSETGVSIVSNPIEDQLLKLFGSSLSTIKSTAFAIAYKTDRSYMLFVPASSSDSNPTVCFRYNTIHDNWTKHSYDTEAGILNDTDDKIHLSDNASAYTTQERKSYDYTDHADEKEQINITANYGDVVTLSDTTNFRIGDILFQGALAWSRVTAIDSSNVTVSDSGWTIDSAIRLAYIPLVLEWLPNSADNPGLMKHYQDPSLFVTDIGFTDFDLYFKTELDDNWESVTINGADLALWGRFPWGSLPWPGSQVSRGTFRTYTPLNKARGSLLTVKLEANIAYRSFGLQGISIPFKKGNEWVRNN